MPFAKGHALGNDYAIIEAPDSPVPPERWVETFCDRHRGIGSDGLLAVERKPAVDASAGSIRFGLSILNPDGTAAEKSGNGLRILAAYLHEAGAVNHGAFQVRLPKDTVTLRVESVRADGSRQVRAEMGRASFAPEDAALDAQPEADTVKLILDSATVEIQPVSLGNPHCVVFVDALDRERFLARAPRLSKHPAFAAGTNVQFARVTGPATLEAWVWERGAGETLASGSSACAVAASAVRQGRVRERALKVHMRGGVLEVDVGDDFACTLRGPARIVYHGKIAVGVLEVWARDSAS